MHIDIKARRGIAQSMVGNRRVPQSLPVAFTLVELLVVIGIITVLIGILLPAVGKARATSQRAACLSNLHQIGLAFQTHSATHKGFYPLAGFLPGMAPGALDDSYRQKYDYGYIYQGPWTAVYSGTTEYESLLTPVEALSVVMGSKIDRQKVQTAADVKRYYGLLNDGGGFIKAFLCPSHTSDVVSGLYWPNSPSPGSVDDYDDQYLTLIAGDAWNGPWTTGSAPSSYIWSEYVMGWTDYGEPGPGDLSNPATAGNRLRGKASAVRHAEATLLACDGFGSSDRGPLVGDLGFPMGTLYNTGVGPSLQVPSDSLHPAWPVTLDHALTPNDVMAGSPEAFDLKRHAPIVSKAGQAAGMVNILFCDGHCESKQITTGDLSKVYLVPPMP